MGIKSFAASILCAASLFIFSSVDNVCAKLTDVENFEEVQMMREKFKQDVNSEMIADMDYLVHVSQDAVNKFTCLGEDSKKSQYFLYVDRNPDRQIAFVGFYNAKDKNVQVIGFDKISTGNDGRRGHFITPTGIFKNTTENIGYRALGTKNSQGWMGLGAKGSRVWDFGWQKTVKNGEERLIRFLIHATDPVHGEQRIGQVDSKGCIRVSAKLNKFLDHYGLLDREYEEQKYNKKFFWLLKKDRQPVAYSGQYLLVSETF